MLTAHLTAVEIIIGKLPGRYVLPSHDDFARAQHAACYNAALFADSRTGSDDQYMALGDANSSRC